LLSHQVVVGVAGRISSAWTSSADSSHEVWSGRVALNGLGPRETSLCADSRGVSICTDNSTAGNDWFDATGAAPQRACAAS
jgi:hypothetical protein